MNIDDLTFKELKEIAAIVAAGGQTSVQKTQGQILGNNRPVIVRSRDAGVQFGYLDKYESDGSAVYLKNARQVWSWTAAEGGTLLDCATHGIKGGKISGPASAVIVIGACAIIDCTETAVKSLEAGKWG